jgi:hypothetical protein
MKLDNKFFQIPILLIFFSTFLFLRDEITLNIFSVNLSKLYFQNNNSKITIPELEESNKKNCRYLWLSNAVIIRKNKDIKSLDFYSNLFSCNYLYVHMMKKVHPLDLSLSEIAYVKYPQDINVLKWVGDSLFEKNKQGSLDIFLQATKLFKNDSYSWGKLGELYENFQMDELAKNAYITSCLNGDNDVNACYNAGKLLEIDNKIDDALFFYSLSKSQYSKRQAYRLELSKIPKENLESFILDKLVDYPNDSYFLEQIGFVYFDKGLIVDATRAFKKSCDIGGPGIDSCYNAGKLLEYQGDFLNAIYYYKKSPSSFSHSQASRLEIQISEDKSLQDP